MNEIQIAIDYYNEQKSGLGKRFHKSVKNTFVDIKKNPQYMIRYDDIRCLSVKSFPYMIHFQLKENAIIVRAVLHTSLNPEEIYL